MSIRTIKQWPDETLVQKSVPFVFTNPAHIELIEDLHDTLVHSGGVGLSAVQIGAPVRIFSVSVEGQVGTFINPRIIARGVEKKRFSEGCLSLDGQSFSVRRHNRVKLAFWGIDGAWRVVEATEYFAQVVQHEIKHLDGSIFEDLMGRAAKYV